MTDQAQLIRDKQQQIIQLKLQTPYAKEIQKLQQELDVLVANKPHTIRD